MADIRIKDLTTTASSTASDDFIAVDGTTNGTRKLNAFSPTFGGNATVTGTLTVNGDTESLGSSASSGTTLKVISGVGTLASPKYSSLAFRTYNDSDTGAYIRTGNRQADTNEWLLEVATRSNANVLTHIATFSDSKLSVLATTASTTTSSGALVVSGGVGVAGALNCGGLFDFAVSANSTQVYTIQNTSTGVSAATRLTFVGGTSSGNIQLYGSGHSTPNILQYASPSSHAWQCNGVERATLSSAGSLTVSSSLTTGAPSGGTFHSFANMILR